MELLVIEEFDCELAVGVHLGDELDLLDVVVSTSNAAPASFADTVDKAQSPQLAPSGFDFFASLTGCA